MRLRLTDSLPDWLYGSAIDQHKTFGNKTIILRAIVITFAGLEAVARIGFEIVLYNNSSDPLDGKIAVGVGHLTATPFVLGVLPALVWE